MENNEINVGVYESDFKSVESHKKEGQNKDVNSFKNVPVRRGAGLPPFELGTCTVSFDNLSLFAVASSLFLLNTETKR